MTGTSFGHAARRTPTYGSWRAMRARCRNRAEYQHLTYDPAWERFAEFLADMGARPPGATLDRIDNAKGYSRENCRWATPEEQTRNRKIAIYAYLGAEYLPLAEIAKRIGKTWKALHHKHALGTLQDYLTKMDFRSRRERVATFRGQLMPITEIAKIIGKHYQTVYKWHNKRIIDDKLRDY